MTREQINYFNTFGFFLSKQLLSREEMEVLGNAFDAAMEKARGGAPIPQPGEKRQQIIPFFDYDAAVFYPLLDDARVLDTFEQLLGEDFILTLSEGIVHTGGSGWHHDAYAPEAGLIPAHRIAEDTRWLVFSSLSEIILMLAISTLVLRQTAPPTAVLGRGRPAPAPPCARPTAARWNCRIR